MPPSRCCRLTCSLPHSPWILAHPTHPPCRPKDIGELREASEAAEAAEAAAASAHAAAGAPSNKKEKHPKGSPFPYGDEVPPPRRDWRAEGKVTPVKDQ